MIMNDRVNESTLCGWSYIYIILYIYWGLPSIQRVSYKAGVIQDYIVVPYK